MVHDFSTDQIPGPTAVIIVKTYILMYLLGIFNLWANGIIYRFNYPKKSLLEIYIMFKIQGE